MVTWVIIKSAGPIRSTMLVSIIDGYIDEPSRLGVPPFISPYPRYIAGAVQDSGHEWEYVTIDHWRGGTRPRGDLTIIIHGALVPGKYLRTMPMSGRELETIMTELKDSAIAWSPQDKGDPDALAYDMLTTGEKIRRRRTLEEWARWPVAGANLIAGHQDFDQPLIAEVDVSYGCPHYISGGCSFCTEPAHGEPVFREPVHVVEEVKALLRAGCTNFRLGGQSCIFCYKAGGIGETSTPEPNATAVGELLKPLASLEGIRVLHTDNANPAIIASHPKASARILDLLVNTCTGGNSLSLGMESADPVVIEANNLNTTPEQVMAAIRLINEKGAAAGPTGMPMLLPGLNFIGGLEGETRDTYRLNGEFLTGVLDAGLMLRRINIRQVASVRRQFAPMKHQREFRRFKTFVRENIDPVMLERVCPNGTVLRDAFTELRMGRITFARQIGTYPLLIGIQHDVHLNKFYDLKVTAHGSRSITAVEYPLDINNCEMSALECLPGIGRKRAARLIRARPYRKMDDVASALDESVLLESIAEYITIGEYPEART